MAKAGVVVAKNGVLEGKAGGATFFRDSGDSDAPRFALRTCLAKLFGGRA